MESEKGYVFASGFDVACYLIIVLLYPIIAFFVQLHMMGSERDLYSATLAGAFFSASYFYDFYSRFRDCRGQKKYIVLILLVGLVVFFLHALFMFGVLIALVAGCDNCEVIKQCLYTCPFFAFYPLGMALFDVGKRLISMVKHRFNGDSE